MPITRSRHAPLLRAGLLLGALALLVLSGCSSSSVDSPAPAEQDRGGDAARPKAGRDPEAGLGAGRDVARGVTTLLDRRAAAVRAGDQAGFASGLSGTGAFRAEQQQYFDNLAQLPVAAYGYRLDPASLVRDGRGHWGTVEIRLRLGEYDERAVVTRDRYRFERRQGRYVVSSVTHPGWELENPPSPQPWDLAPIQVREGAGVLGIFDTGSVVGADRVMAAVEGGIAAMAPRIPLSWDRHVVIYALADPTFLRSLPGVPGGDALAVDGLTFPVMAAPGTTRIASTRVVLNPRLLATDPDARNRLIRHELVHVALGSRDDQIPVWLSEGLAEYLSVQTLAPADRVISGEALDAARNGLQALPDSETFNEQDSLANYGVSWWLCEEIADTYGEPMLWTLVEELAGVPDADAELETVLGVSGRALARDAGRLMLATYEPEEQRERRPGRRSRGKSS